ncbi:hypothetical protein [Salipaludibacillus sp. LMS25]|jgi:ABC-2 type transport system ATP-binding protein/transposase|uniref:hypothetical protein n=1 Tax=Salipaludibacillus sp. LMS25 TaxID=2924031 RepID=UPI0034E96740
MTQFSRERISREVLEEIVQQVEQELKAQDDAIEAADTVDEKRAKKQAVKPLRQFHRAFAKNYLPRLETYETQMGLFWDRNRYSKTDVEATFMRMKDDLYWCPNQRKVTFRHYRRRTDKQGYTRNL